MDATRIWFLVRGRAAYGQRASIVNAAKGVPSIAVLCTATVAHLGTYFGSIMADGPYGVILNVLVLAVLGLALVHLAGEVPRLPVAPRIAWGSVPLSVIRNGMPRWALRLLAIALAYAILNFAIFSLGLTSGARAERRGSEYVLAYHGGVRVVSRAEYEEYRLWEVRGVSGHWVLLSLFPALVFAVRRAANVRE